MIVLDEQLKNSGVAEQIAGWYHGRIVNITSLRPSTVIKDDAIPMLLRQIRDPTFVTINTTDFWRRIAAERHYCVKRIRRIQRLIVFPTSLFPWSFHESAGEDRVPPDRRFCDWPGTSTSPLRTLQQGSGQGSGRRSEQGLWGLPLAVAFAEAGLHANECMTP